MDWSTQSSLKGGTKQHAPCEERAGSAAGLGNRRLWLRWAVGSIAAAGGVAAVGYWIRQGEEAFQSARLSADVFKNDAPRGTLWEAWQRQGWTREALHYLRLGKNIQCRLCPNECVLGPEDRGRCRNRVNKGGTLYTLTYNNPCALNLDPIEKKPLFHFLPGTEILSLATAGCGFRCLNCQNWEISQRRPEQTKDPFGSPLRLNPGDLSVLGTVGLERLTLLPEDVVALAEHFSSPSIAFTYSEPSVWFEYMFDIAQLAHERGLKNVWVTCGYIQQRPLQELCAVIDAANVDLKSFDPQIYGRLNSGKLEPILATLKTLKREGIWFEITNLIVPSYTDDLEMIRRMCHWIQNELGPDYPLHFSRFHPAHQLTHLPSTPVQILLDAQQIAYDTGLRYVYIGNVRGVKEAETTFCPRCHRVLIDRDIFSVLEMHLENGSCSHCGEKIAGVWTT